MIKLCIAVVLRLFVSLTCPVITEYRFKVSVTVFVESHAFCLSSRIVFWSRWGAAVSQRTVLTCNRRFNQQSFHAQWWEVRVSFSERLARSQHAGSFTKRGDFWGASVNFVSLFERFSCGVLVLCLFCSMLH